ncbi:MAG: hypothetical protein ACYTEM_01780 [Planctomycetota bacterium]|jgi:hypothetical protein
MKTKKAFTLAVAVLIAAISAVPVQAKEFDLNEADVHDRMTYHRAVDAAVWAMPLMNFKFYRDVLADAGVSPNRICLMAILN